MALILDGKAIAAKVRGEVAEIVKTAVDSGKRRPCLAVVLAGENPASAVYVRNKCKDCAEVGFESRLCSFPADVTEEVLLSAIGELACDSGVDGILCQLPLPKQIDESRVLQSIPPEKDVDAFHPFNAGLIFQGSPRFLPCTPAGIIRLLDEYKIPIEGRECVIVGRSNIVGKPMAQLLLARNGTVTVCHTRTSDLAQHTRRADLIIAAAGKASLITGDMLKPGATVVDVGMNRNAEGKLCGDCDFESCSRVAGYITPVPGGVGPMTRAMLLVNTVTAYNH